MKEWNFPTGEYGLQIEDETTIYWDWIKEKDIFKICSQLNAVANKFPYATITLVAPYLPYGRQDRIYNVGEALSFDLLIKLLKTSVNSLHWGRLVIKTFALHNEEAANFLNIKSERFKLNNIIKINSEQVIPINVIFPNKQAATHFIEEDNPIYLSYYYEKVRYADGKIIKYELIGKEDMNTDYTTLIVDDICDDGATFIECAELLRASIKDLRLFIYHGFFTKGIEPILESGIKQIYTTDSVCRISHPNLEVQKLKGEE